MAHWKSESLCPQQQTIWGVKTETVAVSVSTITTRQPNTCGGHTHCQCHSSELDHFQNDPILTEVVEATIYTITNITSNNNNNNNNRYLNS